MSQATSKIDAKTAEHRATRGRPRVLTREEILDCAVAIGLEHLTMRKLSDQLNVGASTLYQYFPTRQALFRAAAVHSLSTLRLPEDTGQHWSTLSRDYAICIQEILTENPSLILSHSPTEYGFDVHFRLTERFLRSMTSRGFSSEQGMKIFHIIGMAAFGGAIETVRHGELKKVGATLRTTARKEFRRQNTADFPNLSSAFSVFTYSPSEKRDLLLRAAFKHFAEALGEDEDDLFP